MIAPAMAAVRDAIIDLGHAAAVRCESGTADVPAAIGALGAALDAADADPAGAQLGRLMRLTDLPEDQILLALLAGPALDPELALARDRIAGGGSPHSLGVLLQLASDRDADRDHLRAALGDDRALVKRFLVSRSPGPLTDDSELTIADSVVATLAGLDLHPPTAAQRRAPLEHALAAPVCTALGLWELRPMLTVLCGPDLDGQRAVARLLVAWRDAAAWHVADPAQDWGPLMRDAALANAVIITELTGTDLHALDAIQQAATRVIYPIIGLDGPGRGTAEARGLPRIDLPGSLDPAQVGAVQETVEAIAAVVGQVCDASQRRRPH